MRNMNDKYGSFIHSQSPKDAGDARSEVETTLQTTSSPPSSPKLHSKAQNIKNSIQAPRTLKLGLGFRILRMEVLTS